MDNNNIKQLSTYKKILNNNNILDPDPVNKTNGDNQRIYSNILYGYSDSPMFSYLRNLNCLRLNDLKSMKKFNEMNYSYMLMNSEVLRCSEILDYNTIKLPTPAKKIKQYISNTINNRKSCRNFSGNYISLKDFSTILFYSFGIAKKRKKFMGENEIHFRNYPSGGGLYPIDIIIYCNKISTISNGFYKYQPYTHSLLKMNVSQYDINQFMNTSMDIQNCNFILFFEYTVNKSYLKYGELSLLNALIEVGCMSENFDLISISMGRKTCPVTALNKHYLEKILTLDGIDQILLFSNICGDEE